MQTLQIFFLIPRIALWHYTTGISSYISLWGNSFFFLYHFFSVPFLLKTFFEPWKRLDEHARPGLHPVEWTSALIVTSIMRAVGMCARIFLLLLAILGFVFVCVGGALGLVVWLLLPVLVGVVLFWGVVVLIHATF